MADDERSTFPHRIREREVNLPRSSKGLPFLSFLLSALNFEFLFQRINLFVTYTYRHCNAFRLSCGVRDFFMFL